MKYCRLKSWIRRGYHSQGQGHSCRQDSSRSYRPTYSQYHRQGSRRFRQWVPSYKSKDKSQGSNQGNVRSVQVTVWNQKQNGRSYDDIADSRRYRGYKVNPKITVISDSMYGRIFVPGVKFQIIGGLNLDRAYEYIEGGQRLSVTEYDIVIIHIGTVELRRLLPEEYSKKVQGLIKLVREINPECHIALSNIIPRPIDFHSGNSGIKVEKNRQEFNAELKRVDVWERCYYLRSEKPFIDRNDPARPNEDLFRNVKYDGVHLNFHGSKKLENYLSGSIALLKGKWRSCRS